MSVSHGDIIRYYESCEIDYRLVWDLKRSRAMHYGFWEPDVRSLADALDRQNRRLAEYAAVKPTDRVLDAGCGVGGSCLYLADEIGCRAVGISLSPGQIGRARAHARGAGLDELATFQVGDFTATEFADESFDVVWAIESVCHVENKSDFIREAWRLLKPGGRLIVADGFLTRHEREYDEPRRNMMRSWLQPWAISNLAYRDAFRDELLRVGFADDTLRILDATELVRPSSRLLYLHWLWTWLPAQMLRWLRVRSATQQRNHGAARYQWIALRRNLWCYMVFAAVKP